MDDLRAGQEQACVALWNECGLLVPHNDPHEDIALFQAAPSARILVAHLDGQIVGSVCVGHDGHRGWLYYLAVKLSYRQQGVAGTLLKVAENWLSSQDVRKVQLMIRPDNQPVATFYQKQGYQLTPRAMMAKWLSGEASSTLTTHESAYLDTEITYLEMTSPRSFSADETRLPDDCLLLRANRPPPSFYRYLYNTVGEPWLWWERRILSDDELNSILHACGHELHVLYRGGVPAGFGELERRKDGNVELSYFGLLPEFIGQALGRPFLKSIVQLAWQVAPSAVPKCLKVNTCNLDHPRALSLYQSVGFSPSSRETKRIIHPRSLGLFETT
ncbi:GNAT family acetyltransferase [Fodinicurvata fenggangensis]|uniref:GNAT family acetyltransferase n=1 Tax=Fodinicurvata fenggangensis TaxID=1121830 RepID=UPI002480D96D|nr:GNAT family acetyltransferase [Fodinicurvata fenggangensis]